MDSFIATSSPKTTTRRCRFCRLQLNGEAGPPRSVARERLLRLLRCLLDALSSRAWAACVSDPVPGVRGVTQAFGRHARSEQVRYTGRP